MSIILKNLTLAAFTVAALAPPSCLILLIRRPLCRPCVQCNESLYSKKLYGIILYIVNKLILFSKCDHFLTKDVICSLSRISSSNSSLLEGISTDPMLLKTCLSAGKCSSSDSCTLSNCFCWLISNSFLGIL